MFMQIGPTPGQVHAKEIHALKFVRSTKLLFPSSSASSPLSLPAFDVGQADKISGLFPYEIEQMQAPFYGYRVEIPAAGSDVQITRFLSTSRVQWNDDRYGTQRIPPFHQL